MLARALALAIVAATALGLPAAEISVGPGRGLTRIEDAIPLAKPGDTVVVHARADGQPYPRTALRLLLPQLTLRGVPDSSGQRPVLDGAGVPFASGDLPRAIVEIGPEAEGASVRGFRLTGARASDQTAAGVRVDGADRVIIEDCEITACDVGVLSVGAADTARDLLISDCEIHRNATAPAEIDLLDDAGVSDRAGGLMLVLGCVLAKRADCPGERAVIRCGQDRGGDRVGTLFLAHTTVITTYQAPVVELSAPGAKASFANCIVADPSGGGPGRMLLARRGGEPAEPAWAGGLWLAHGYAAPRRASGVTIGVFREVPPFVDFGAGDLRLAAGTGMPYVDAALPLAQLPLPVSALPPEHSLRRHPPYLLGFRAGRAEVRAVIGEGLDLGAFEAQGP